MDNIFSHKIFIFVLKYALFTLYMNIYVNTLNITTKEKRSFIKRNPFW